MSHGLWYTQEYLRQIGETLQIKQRLKKKEANYIAAALQAIYQGIDANVALHVKGGKGQSRSIKERKASDNKAMALGWVAETMCLGASEADACLAAEEHFGINSEALQTYRGSKKSNRDPHFKLALSRKLKC